VLHGTRYEIGAAGDEVLVGDWTCTGAALVALVRPAFGEVYVFDRLPAAGAEAPARQVARLEAGAHLESGPTDPARGCAPLLGRFPDGSTAAITVLPPEGTATEELP
jgi:hypothetical protein